MQSTASKFTEQWIEGQLTRTSPLDQGSLVNDDAAVSKVGYVQIKGTDPARQGKKPIVAFSFADFSGIIQQAIGLKEKALSTGVIELANGDGFTVLRRGYMAVKITQDVSYDDPVFFVHTGGGASAQWTYRKDLDTDKASKIPALYKQAGSSGDIVEIFVNFSMQIGVS